jgi:hypothetical protein
MPRLASFGSASWNAFRAKNLPQATFRSSATVANGNSPINKPAGIEVGDLVLVFFSADADYQTLQTSGGSVWPIVFSSDGRSSCAAKVLTATDVSNSWVYSFPTNIYCVALAYKPNGATGIALGTVTKFTGVANPSIPGVSNGNSRGVIAALDTSLTGNPSSGSNPGAPFTTRRTPGNLSAVSESLTGGYTGANVVFTGVDTGGDSYGFLIKFT